MILKSRTVFEIGIDNTSLLCYNNRIKEKFVSATGQR